MDELSHTASIEEFLNSPTRDRCLLVVHRDTSKLDLLAGRLTQRGLEQVSIGSELSPPLLDVPRPGRPRAATRWMRSRLGEPTANPRICRHIDLLFEPELELDPLMLLKQVSRTTRIIAMWPGSYTQDVLVYAVPEHSHYRTWRRPEVAVVVLDEVK